MGWSGKGDRHNLPGRPFGCCAQIEPVPFSCSGYGVSILWNPVLLLGSAILRAPE